MALINAFIAALSILGMIAIAYGYRGSLLDRYTATWFFGSSVIVLAASVIFRLVYWDIIWATMRHNWPEAARDWASIMGRTEMNLIFNAIFLLGIYLGLKSRQLLIPASERVNWPWYICWLHPAMPRFWQWR